MRNNISIRKSRKINKKSLSIIELNSMFVTNSGLPRNPFNGSDPGVDLLCWALYESSKGTKHYYDAMQLIKTINGTWVDSNFDEIEAGDFRIKLEFDS